MKRFKLFAVLGVAATLASFSAAQAFDGLGHFGEGPHLGWGDGFGDDFGGGIGFNRFGEPRGLRPHLVPRSERRLTHPFPRVHLGGPHLHRWGYGGGFGDGFGHHGFWPHHHGFGSSWGYDDSDDDHDATTTTSSATAAKCAQQFRSYNPATGTYLGYDGKRHPCP